MRLLSRKHKILGTLLSIVSVMWVADALTGGDKPAGARAGVLPDGAPTGPGTLPPDSPDIADLIRLVTQPRPQQPDLQLEQLRRDLFAPTELVLAACRPAEPAAPDEQSQEPVELPFEQRHKLSGVLMGRVPLAVIDGKLLSRGAELDGHTLVQIHRDRVVLRQNGSDVVLTIATPPP